jgi:DNA invertase Pin-like site-specific DNA recombinase
MQAVLSGRFSGWGREPWSRSQRFKRQVRRMPKGFSKRCIAIPTTTSLRPTVAGRERSAESKRNDRPALAKALALCSVHGATLFIAKLDRLARNVNFISNLMESGVEFTAVDFPQASRLTIHIVAAVAEHESCLDQLP